MSKYHAIGKELWDELPNIFGDNETVEAEGLKGGERFWSYTYMFLSKSQNGTCHMEAGISYSALTGLFTKYVKSEGVIVDGS